MEKSNGIEYIKGYGRCHICGTTIDHKYQSKMVDYEGENLLACEMCATKLADRQKDLGGKLKDFAEKLVALTREYLDLDVPPFALAGLLQYQVFCINMKDLHQAGIKKEKEDSENRTVVSGNSPDNPS